MYNRGDFHLHTNASDGKLSPKELIHEAWFKWSRYYCNNGS